MSLDSRAEVSWALRCLLSLSRPKESDLGQAALGTEIELARSHAKQKELREANALVDGPILLTSDRMRPARAIFPFATGS